MRITGPSTETTGTSTSRTLLFSQSESVIMTELEAFSILATCFAVGWTVDRAQRFMDAMRAGRRRRYLEDRLARAIEHDLLNEKV